MKERYDYLCRSGQPQWSIGKRYIEKAICTAEYPGNGFALWRDNGIPEWVGNCIKLFRSALYLQLIEGSQSIDRDYRDSYSGCIGVFSEISVEKNYVTIKLFIMRLLNYCFLIGGILIASCVGNSSNKSQNDKKINPADTIYLGDLREKFEGDSVFFAKVAPDLILTDYQYFWAATESDAIANGLTKDYYKKVKQEITATNEAIKKGVMKGANVKRIPDFQSVK